VVVTYPLQSIIAAIRTDKSKNDEERQQLEEDQKGGAQEGEERAQN